MTTNRIFPIILPSTEDEMAQAKFELTSETTSFLGRTLFRIRALVDFGWVKKGDLGGFVEKPENVSHEGDAWVYGNARVYGDAQVYGDARVYGNAWVQIGPIGSRAATLTASADAVIGVRVTTGCFSGSLAEFEAAVQETHGDTEHGKHYRLAIALIKAKLGGGDGMFGSVPNCRLIAAAPDLLEALHTIMRQPGFEPDEPYGVQALAAIAKAEGAS